MRKARVIMVTAGACGHFRRRGSHRSTGKYPERGGRDPRLLRHHRAAPGHLRHLVPRRGKDPGLEPEGPGRSAGPGYYIQPFYSP